MSGQAVLAAQLVVEISALAAAYALVALGFVLILNATGAVNFSHGDLVMLGGLLAATLAGYLPLPGIVLLPILLAGMALLGLMLAATAWFPLRERPPDTVFISTIAVGVILQNAAALLFGPEPRGVPPLIGGDAWRVGGLVIERQAVAIIAVAALLVLALHVLFTRAQLGYRLRATAQDRDMAAMLGIRVDRMVFATFAVGSALAGAAGLLLANSFFVSPTDGANYILKAYVATVIGGWGSLPGAVAGALLIAAFEVLYPSLPLLVPSLARRPELFSQTAAAIVLDLVILAILIVRPQGLFGEAVRQRA